MSAGRRRNWRRFAQGACAVGSVGWTIAAAAAPAPTPDDAYAAIEHFAEALSVVRARYLDPRRVAYRDLVRAALRGVASELDPYSDYLEPEELQADDEERAGEYGGLGLMLQARDRAVVVTDVLAGSAAEIAGLRPRDILLAADDHELDPPDPGAAARWLRGAPGTRVRLRIRRPSDGLERTLLIERDWVLPPSVTDAALLPGGIGYVRIAAFDERTPDGLADALDELALRGARAWLLDLRDNPGGGFDAAIAVAGQFLPRRVPVVRAAGRRPEDSGVWRAGGRGARLEPLVILVNGGTASAAEIVAGALRDHGRAVLAGEPSYGKGSIQSLCPLPDGAALRLTVAAYFTPGGHPIHDAGLTPDLWIPDSPADWAARAERWGLPADDIRAAAGAAAYEPPAAGDIQCDRAASVLRMLLDRPKAP